MGQLLLLSRPEPAFFRAFSRLGITGTSGNPGKLDKNITYIYVHFKTIDYSLYPNLQVVMCPCSGIHHLLPGLPAHVRIMYLDNKQWMFGNARSAAEWTIKAMLTLLDNDKRQLSCQTIGMVGFGRVAQQVAYMLLGFNVNIKYYDQRAFEYFKHSNFEHIKKSSLKETLNSSIVSIHLSENDTTKNFISSQEFKHMGNAYFINGSRSSIVDGEDLISYAETELNGVFLDVIETYSADVKEQLFKMSQIKNDNVHLSFHTAGKSREARESTDLYVVQQFISWKTSQNEKEKQL